MSCSHQDIIKRIRYNLPKTTYERNKIIVIDFETATRDHMPCQIGITPVHYKRGLGMTETFLIKPPQNYYDKSMFRYHGIRPEMTEEAFEFPGVWDQIKHHFDDAVVVAHNAVFDLNVLMKTIDRYELERPKIADVIDTYHLTGLKLQVACNAMGIDSGLAHDAGCDSRACAQLLQLYMTDDEQRLLELNFLMEEALDNTSNRGGSRQKHYGRDGVNESAESSYHKKITKDQSSIFFDKRVCVTGVYSMISRDDIKESLRRIGAKVTAMVSTKTDFLVMGNEPGPKKMMTAYKLNSSGDAKICLVTESQLLKELDRSIEFAKNTQG